MKVPPCLCHPFCCAAFALTLALRPDTAAAAPGELDVTFNPSGTDSQPGTRVNHFPGLSLRYFALQADGRIVSAGFAERVPAPARWIRGFEVQGL